MHHHTQYIRGLGAALCCLFLVSTATAESITPLNGGLVVSTSDSWGTNTFSYAEPSSVSRICTTDGRAEITEATIRFSATAPGPDGGSVVYKWKATVSGQNQNLRGTLRMDRYTCGRRGRCAYFDSLSVPTRATADGFGFIGMQQPITHENVGVHAHLRHQWSAELPLCPPPDTPDTPDTPDVPEPPEMVVR